MKSFGSFQTTEVIAATEGIIVYKARRGVADNFAIKVFSLPHFAGKDEEKAKKFSDQFYNHIEIQKKAALTSPYVAQVFEFGLNDDSAWYATGYYLGSAQRLVAGKIALSKENFHHLISSVVRGALDLKKICGRPHGDLKPGNVLFAGTGKLIVGQVVLTDPASGGSAQAAQFELADLHAIGEIIHRLVFSAETHEDDFWKLPPAPSLREWSKIFGKDADRWHALCSRLLDPALTLKNYDLEELQQDIVRLKAGSKVAPLQLAFGLGLVALGAVVGGILWKNSGSGNANKGPDVSASVNKGPSEREANLAAAKAVSDRERAQEEAARIKAEQETQRLLEEKRLAEAKAGVDTKAQQEDRLKVEAAEKGSREAARRAEEAEAKRLVAEQALAEAKLKQNTAVEQAVRAKAEEARREAMQVAEKAKQEAAEKAAEADRLRKEVEEQKLASEAKLKALALELAQNKKQAEIKLASTVPENVNTSIAPLESLDPKPTTKPHKGEVWMNSMEMHFAPIGQGNVLFATWETRFKDFEEFAKPARHPDPSWRKTTFKQGSTHPVVNINCKEAEAFCRWLTEVERHIGLISKDQAYRLPTDAEWSEAARTKNPQASLYFWGAAWPPPAGAGNFASSCSYDRFESTAPVGQFRLKPQGFQDLAGNVWEMCSSQSGYVGRGGSWLSTSPEELSLSFQLPLNPADRQQDVGFRCVLDLGK